MRMRILGALLVAFALGLALSAPVSAADGPLTVQSIDTKDYPSVRLTLTVPPSLAKSASQPEFTVRENGREVREISAKKLELERMTVRVILVMDTSGSMKGEPLADAQKAAKRFARSLGNGAEVALISFADGPKMVSLFTSDGARLDGGIDELRASGETALYDALVVAAGMVPRTQDSRTSIVVLSDGGDTVSNASFDKAVGALKGAGAPVYAVALKSDEYNAQALRLLAKDTNGRLVPVAKSSSLSRLFEGIAQEISTAWSVSYTSSQPRTKDIELDVAGSDGKDTASASLAYPNPVYADVAGTPLIIPSVAEANSTLLAFVGLGFLAVVLLAVGVLLMFVRDRNSLDSLAYYDQLQAAALDESYSGAAGQVRARMVDAVAAVAGRRGIIQLANQRLEAAGLPLRPSEYMTAHLLAVVASGVIVELLSGSFALSMLVVVVATAGPVVAIDIAADRRRRRFDEQLPDVLAMIAGSLRGGWGVQQAISLAAQEAPSPACDELKRVDTETRLGVPLERALQSMADRMGGSDFQAAVTAISIQREVGGNLAEVLDIVAKTIRERDAMRRQVKALTSEGRLSMWILIALPFFVGGIMLLTSPAYIMTLLGTPVGWLVLLVGAVLLVIGTVWMHNVTKIEV